MTISLKISELIFKKKTKKKDLYTYLGISKQTLEDYLSEKTSMTVVTLRKIATYFNVPISYFFDENKQSEMNIKGNKNQVGNGNVIIEAQANEIEHLKRLLSEKERTIQILMKQQAKK
ncbi:MAG: helix-turn-helix domain-containing protein [Rickettsiales bacterium]|jgi:transcriptional regulator with XRE-family HTH domain|nr:helix-turn-helix domain-containing protein [Rickettsiales bacterium]